MQSDCSISAKSNGSESSHSIQLQMRTIISEFKGVYQQKLRALDEEERHLTSGTTTTTTRPESLSMINDKLRLKVKTLESYVKDLLEQNDVLVQTIDELEREANSRVAKLENKIHKFNAINKVNNCY